MSDLKINNITNRSGSDGPTIAGVSTVSTSAFMVMPSGDSSNRVGVSTYITNGTIPTEGLRILLDAGDINSNDPSDPENIWKNLADHPKSCALPNDIIKNYRCNWIIRFIWWIKLWWFNR